MELVISDTEIRLIYLHTIYLDKQLSIKWSGKFHWKSGKSQGILFSHFCGNPEVVVSQQSVRTLFKSLAFLAISDQSAILDFRN